MSGEKSLPVGSVTLRNSFVSPPAPVYNSPLPGGIVITTVNEDTGRRPFYGPETDLSASKSRHNKVCRVCGAEKVGRGPTCQACYDALRKTTISLQCCWCKAAFERPRHQHEKALRMGCKEWYCSAACSRDHHAIKNRKLCLTCQKPTPRNTMKYCSDGCRKAARPKPEFVCSICGVIFSKGHTRQRYCSRDCADRAHGQRMRGSGNSHFKTGTSYAKWFREMRPLILERDQRRCVTCQQIESLAGRRTNLRVHHINHLPWDNRAQNLVTLCKSCHLVHHKSKKTPWPWLSAYAVNASRSMTSRWRATVISLQTAYSSTTA